MGEETNQELLNDVANHMPGTAELLKERFETRANRIAELEGEVKSLYKSFEITDKLQEADKILKKVLKERAEKAEASVSDLTVELKKTGEREELVRDDLSKLLGENQVLELSVVGMREEVRRVSHWFNEQVRLYNDVSQSLVARNFQIENFAKAGLEACMQLLKSSTDAGKIKARWVNDSKAEGMYAAIDIVEGGLDDSWSIGDSIKAIREVAESLRKDTLIPKCNERDSDGTCCHTPQCKAEADRLTREEGRG